MTKKIIIIGAGIAGLSAGCYGQMNGFDTEIFEMHSIPGGMCTSWCRKGYTMDGCIDWLMGTTPKSQFYNYWNELGILKDRKFIAHDIVLQVEDNSGNKLVVYSDIDKLEKQLLEISPEDEPMIKEFADAVRCFTGLNMPMDKPKDMYGMAEWAKMFFKAGSKLNKLSRYNKISVEEFTGQFKNQFLREAFSVMIPKDYTAFVLIMMLATYNNGDAAWPIGGSLEFARDIERKYLDLGGKIHYKSRVESIIVNNDNAAGIRLADGSEYKSDYVVSAADGYTAIFRMLEGKYVNDTIKALYTSTPTSHTSVQVSVGVDYDLSQYPHVISVKLDKPLNIGGVEATYIPFKHFCYDNTLCPQGKSVIKSIIGTKYEYWENLYKNPEGYRAEKERIAAEYIRVFENRFPGAKGKIEIIDVATPVTYVRYTGSWKGIYMSWMTTPENTMLSVPSRLPGLDGFYMAGQWSFSSGGVPVGVITGRWSILRICKDEGKTFVVK